jgi:hypothetical protein
MNAYKRVNQHQKADDMAAWLINHHREDMPRFSHRSVVIAALTCAHGLTDDAWADLSAKTNRKRECSDETKALVIAKLKAQCPVMQGNEFQGLPA